MAENDFVPWATGVGANVLDQADYLANPAVTAGVVAGTAGSALYNKAQRQGNFFAAVLAKFIVDQIAADVLDNGDLPGKVTLFETAILHLVSLVGYAPIDSPAFTDNPTAPTQPLNIPNLRLANTTFVINQIAAYLNSFLAIGTFSHTFAVLTTTGSFSTAHGLGAIPKSVYGYIICNNADNGYAAGDCVVIPVNTGITVWSNATQLGLSTTNSGIFIEPKGGGATQAIDITKWSAVLFARSY